MNKNAKLVVASPVRNGRPFLHECSLCHLHFIFPEDRDAKTGAAELLAAFKEHVREQHPEDLTS